MASKWNRGFFEDLAERVGSTLIFQLITLLTLTNTNLDSRIVWTVVGLPTVLSVLKGVLANMKSPETGASLLPPEKDQEGSIDPGSAALGALVGAAVVWLILR